MIRSFLVAVAAMLATAAAAVPGHPAELAPLTGESTFPRFTAEELAAAGFPDHFHVFAYPGFEPLVDENGATYGIFSLSHGTAVEPRDGLEIETGSIAYRGIRLHFNPEYQAFQVMPMVEVLDWARRDVAAWLGHDRSDTLQVYDTTDLDEYRARTGHAFHRLFKYEDGVFVIEPAYIMFKRGLAAHAAFHMVAEWLLDDMAGEAVMPVWLVDGLASYLAEEGTHHLNFLAMYRPDHDVIMTPDVAVGVLAGPPDFDDETDKRQVRTAEYTAFLMAWELVENRGGLAPVRDLFARTGRGEDPDAVCRELYGVDLAELAAQLDPTLRPEPVGEAVQPRSPQMPPGR